MTGNARGLPFCLWIFMSNAYQLHMPHWPKSIGPEPAGTPAARARMLLERLGHPELKLPPVVHVGGTKGKGSTIAFLRAMLEAAGYKVHAYTSPHLARFNERIVLAGHEIGDEQLYAALEEVRMQAGGYAGRILRCDDSSWRCIAFAAHAGLTCCSWRWGLAAWWMRPT